MTDARIQAAKVIAVILGSSYREPGEGGTGAERSLPISERESSMRMGGRWSEGMGRAAICTANNRTENGMVSARSRGTMPILMLIIYFFIVTRGMI